MEGAARLCRVAFERSVRSTSRPSEGPLHLVPQEVHSKRNYSFGGRWRTPTHGSSNGAAVSGSSLPVFASDPDARVCRGASKIRPADHAALVARPAAGADGPRFQPAHGLAHNADRGLRLARSFYHTVWGRSYQGRAIARSTSTSEAAKQAQPSPPPAGGASHPPGTAYRFSPHA